MTNAELAVLSLIVEEARHGYQIEQVIEQRGMRNWTEVGFSSIYYLLNKLEKKEIIESYSAPADGRGPAKKVYRITQKGFNSWQQAALSAIAQPKQCMTSFLIGLSVLPALPFGAALKALETYQIELEERYSDLKKQMNSQQPLPPHVEAMFDYSLTLIATEKKWLRKYLINLKEEGDKNEQTRPNKEI